jgi:hypothetical protein
MLNPNIEIRWPASCPVTGWIVLRGNNPHPVGHPYDEYWMGVTRGRDRNGPRFTKDNPRHAVNLFDEKGEFLSPGSASYGFIVPALATLEKKKRLLKQLRKKKLYYDNKDLLMTEQTEDCAKTELQISELELQLNG